MTFFVRCETTIVRNRSGPDRASLFLRCTGERERDRRRGDGERRRGETEREYGERERRELENVALAKVELQVEID